MKKKRNKSFRNVFRMTCPHCRHIIISPNEDEMYACENCGRETGYTPNNHKRGGIKNAFLLNDDSDSIYYNTYDDDIYGNNRLPTPQEEDDLEELSDIEFGTYLKGS